MLQLTLVHFDAEIFHSKMLKFTGFLSNSTEEGGEDACIVQIIC